MLGFGLSVGIIRAFDAGAECCLEGCILDSIRVPTKEPRPFIGVLKILIVAQVLC